MSAHAWHSRKTSKENRPFIHPKKNSAVEILILLNVQIASEDNFLPGDIDVSGIIYTITRFESAQTNFLETVREHKLKEAQMSAKVCDQIKHVMHNGYHTNFVKIVGTFPSLCSILL